jgi:hypothetical protein
VTENFQGREKSVQTFDCSILGLHVCVDWSISVVNPHIPEGRAALARLSRAECVCLCGIFSPVKPNACLRSNIGRPAARLAYLTILGTNKVNLGRYRCFTKRCGPSQVQAHCIKCEPGHVHKYESRAK